MPAHRARVDIVRATPDLAAQLTRIAIAAKSYWGYPRRWIEHWTPQLTLSAAYVAANPTYVALDEGRPAGFYALVLFPAARRAQLDHLWLDPPSIGRGLGRTLFEHAMATAHAAGTRAVFLEAEPKAEPFYLHMGARRIGESTGEIDGQPRVLPLMEIDPLGGPAT
jgi:GNAT superfamily N-acetyltransferase